MAVEGEGVGYGKKRGYCLIKKNMGVGMWQRGRLKASGGAAKRSLPNTSTSGEGRLGNEAAYQSFLHPQHRTHAANTRHIRPSDNPAELKQSLSGLEGARPPPPKSH